MARDAARFMNTARKSQISDSSNIRSAAGAQATPAIVDLKLTTPDNCALTLSSGGTV